MEKVKVIVNGKPAEMTDGELKSFGRKRALKRKMKSWTLLIVLTLVWAGGIFAILKDGSTMREVIAVIPLIIVIIAMFYSSNNAAKRFCRAVKARPQPVKID